MVTSPAIRRAARASRKDTLIEKLEPLYDATLRRVGPVHGLLRQMLWSGGDVVVRAASRLARFEVPAEHLLPLYKLEMLLGTYESQTVRACRRLVRPGMTVADVGAHVGYYTRRFSRWVGPQGLVLAFEPHPANFDMLRRNMERARLRNVRLFPFAVSDREGTATLWETPLSTGHSLHAVKPEAGRQLARPTVSLDAVCRSEGVFRVDLVKMDVEGGEPEVLKGMAGLARQSPRLAILMEFKAELLARRGYDPAQVLQTLSAFGC